MHRRERLALVGDGQAEIPSLVVNFKGLATLRIRLDKGRTAADDESFVGANQGRGHGINGCNVKGDKVLH